MGSKKTSSVWAASVAALFAPLITATFVKNYVEDVSDAATVDFSNNTGPAEQLCSGFIGGIPFVPNQIPSHFYTDMGFRGSRGGGMQGGDGWTTNVSSYEEQFAATLSAYRTTRQYNGSYTWGLGGLWVLNVSTPELTPHPGADGDWSDYNAFLTRWIHDMKINYATEACYLDIWNEPDYPQFWTAGLDHFLQLWGLTYHKMRAEFPELKLLGPTYSNWTGNWIYPTNVTGYEGDWWNKWASFIKANDSIPDEYVWHMENNRTGGTMLTANGFLQDLLDKYDLPRRPLNINEYAVEQEQSPAGSSWWIAQLERVNAVALRGNWGSSIDYFDDGFAYLLWKPNYTNPTGTGYYPNGEYQVYKYYNQQMNGWRAGSLPSSDTLFDTHVVVGDDDTVRVLAGARNISGTWVLQLNNLEALGLPLKGQLDVKTLEFPFPGRRTPVYAPIDLGTTTHKYSDGTMRWPVHQADNVTAHAYEFKVKRHGSHRV